MDLKKQLHTILLRSPKNLFDEFIKECQIWYSEPAHSLQEMRVRDNKKVRGDIFEDFCALYLKNVKGFDKVWLLDDIPEEILTGLSLKRKDMGIDIIVNHGDEWYAVQCKYKTPEAGKKKCITWKSLSTFYAMCLRTGPWSKYIVMTNCDYTRRQGPKGPKDISMCLKTFQNITSEDWVRMCEIEGKKIEDKPSTVLSEKDVRELRLSFYKS